MRIPILQLVCLLSITASAQDSIVSRRIFMSETQSTLSPSLVSQFGKHVIRTDITLLPEPSIENSKWVTHSQFAYQTQLGKHHGIGVYHTRNNSEFLIENQTGLQYGFRARLAKQGLFQHTDLGLGFGFSIQKQAAHSENIIFYDQLDTTGIIYPTGEKTPTHTHINPLMHASVNLIGNRAHFLLSVTDIGPHSNGLYDFTSELSAYFATEAGIKIITIKQFSLWE